MEAIVHCLGLPYWHYQLVLSWYLLQPESHQLSLQNLSHLRTDIRTQRSDPRYLGPIKIQIWIPISKLAGPFFGISAIKFSCATERGNIFLCISKCRNWIKECRNFCHNNSWDLLATLCCWSFGPTFPALSHCIDIFSLQERDAKKKSISDIQKLLKWFSGNIESILKALQLFICMSHSYFKETRCIENVRFRKENPGNSAKTMVPAQPLLLTGTVAMNHRSRHFLLWEL